MFAHTTRAVASLYQMSHLVCSVECKQLPGAVGTANVFYVVGVTGCDNERIDIRSRQL